MNITPQHWAVAALALGLAWPLAGHSQAAMDHNKMDHGKTDSVAPSLADGEIKKIDAAASKVTIKHGHIAHLDMPGMTMVFTVKDPAILGPFKAGDKVRFMVVVEGGKMVVTELQPGN